MQEVTITVRDGTEIGAAVYAPEGGGRYPKDPWKEPKKAK